MGGAHPTLACEGGLAAVSRNPPSGRRRIKVRVGVSSCVRSANALARTRALRPAFRSSRSPLARAHGSRLDVFEPNSSTFAQASACLRDTIEESRIVL